MASFVHGTAGTVTIALFNFEKTEDVPRVTHKTPALQRLSYLVGVRQRRASLTLRAKTATEHDDFITWYRAVIAAGTTFTFTPDSNIPGDAWTARFEDGQPLTFSRIKAGNKVVGDFSVSIEESPVNL